MATNSNSALEWFSYILVDVIACPVLTIVSLKQNLGRLVSFRQVPEDLDDCCVKSLFFIVRKDHHNSYNDRQYNTRVLVLRPLNWTAMTCFVFLNLFLWGKMKNKISRSGQKPLLEFKIGLLNHQYLFCYRSYIKLFHMHNILKQHSAVLSFRF